MRVVVTGAAGFIGSRLVGSLLAEGHDVCGIDAFTDSYDPARKRANIAGAANSGRFRLVEADLRTDDLEPLVAGADAVYHLAARAGVRESWSRGFGAANEHNVLATQRLLEAVAATEAGRLVLASSSSVYGDTDAYPTAEQAALRPRSPYGVTKMAAEHLAFAYAAEADIDVVVLRLFSVYGPRQRPDMLFAKAIAAALDGAALTLYGDGSQERDFTHVDDVVTAFLAAAEPAVPTGTVCNIGGGLPVEVGRALEVLAKVLGVPLRREAGGEQPGDVARTAADISTAAAVLGWKPQLGLREGLEDQVAWSLAQRH